MNPEDLSQPIRASGLDGASSGEAPRTPAEGAGPLPQRAGEPSTPAFSTGSGAAHAPGWPDPAWDRYRCDRLLGAGGMGRVFKAWDPRLRRWVALKFLHADDPELATRFLREAQAQARIEHPHICRVYEVGEAGGRPYIAMQYIDGSPLGACAEGLTLEQKALMMSRVAEAIHAAHRLGIIHRDIKPANIMLEDTEGGIHPYVVDFGLVREIGVEGLTLSGAALGTPQFMSPEQALGKMNLVDRRSDVYSLGATLYAVVAGRPPHGGETPLEAILRLIHDEPVPLRRQTASVPRDLDTIVMKCLEKEPARRYDSARALADDLGRFLNGEPVAARPSGWAYRLGKRIRKNRLLVGVAVLALVVTLVLVGLWWQARRTAAAQAELARRFTQKVERVEGLLWRAQSLEPHDIRPMKAQVRRQLGEIEAEMRRLGSLAEGPGHSALGRGYVALHEYERGREHLEAAWRAGQRTPDVAYAMGLALGKLYEQELARLRQIPDAEARSARRKEIETTLRDPARAALRGCAREELVAPEYVEALLAYYEDRDEEALAKARQALRRVPWLYEALLVEGSVHLRKGRTQVQAGRYETTRAEYRAAEALFRNAARIGRSDPTVYQAIGVTWQELLHMEVWDLGQADPETYRRTVSALEEALRVMPDDTALMSLLVEAHTDWSEDRLFRGQDITVSVREARRVAEEALRLRPDDTRLLVGAGGVCWQEGKGLLTMRGDPRAVFAKGIGYVQRAAAVKPGYFSAWNTLGLILMDLAVYERTQGQDPAGTIGRCAEAFRRARELNPKEVALLLNIVLAELTLLEDQVAKHSGRPDQAAERARESLRGAEKLNPNIYWIYRIRGEVDLVMARATFLQGVDPAALLASADRDFQHSLMLNPNDPQALCHLANVRIEIARDEFLKGKSPASRLAEARSFIRQAQELSPARADLKFLREKLAQTEAEWKGRKPAK